MYVYLCTERPGELGSLGVWTVGHYSPSTDKFIGTADYGTEDAAAERVAFLNGGDTAKNLRRLEGVVRQLITRVDMVDGHVTRSLALMGRMLQREAARAGVPLDSPGSTEVADVLTKLESFVPDDKAREYEQDGDELEYPERCTSPNGHEWNRSAGEADEARLSGDIGADNIRCIHCGADGDA